MGARRGAGDLDEELHGPVGGQLVEQVRDVAGDPGAHQHVVDAGQHRAVGGRRGGHLDLLEEVDADQPVVALLREPHLDEVAEDPELLRELRLPQGEPGQRRVRGAGRAPARPEVPGDDALGDLGHRECGERAPDGPVVVAVLQAACQDEVQRRPCDDTELAGPGDL